MALFKEHRRHARSGEQLSLILLDIDHFKAYNDSYGHIAGDKCLQMIARVLESCANRPSDLAARFGGEEFVCILPETALGGAVAVAEKIRRSIMDINIPHKSSSVADRVTASFGVAAAHCSTEGSATDLLKQADTLLYRAKESGRNRVDSDI